MQVESSTKTYHNGVLDRNNRLTHVDKRIGEEALEFSLGVSHHRHRSGVDDPAALPSGPHKATGLEHAKVVRNGLARHVQPLLQLSRTHVPSVKQLQYAQARIRG